MKEFYAADMKELTQRMEIEYARKQGKLEAKLEAKLKGKLEGKLEEKLAIAEKLLAQNLISIEKLAEISELPLSQIIAIKHSVAQA